jgi:predicted nucleotidyltransferase
MLSKSETSHFAARPSTGKAYGHIKIKKGEIKAFCQRHHIKSLALFGSILRDDFNPDSDIDVLVEFRKGQTPGFLGLADMEHELSALLGERKIDMRTPQDLSPYFRDRVLQEAEVICR